MDFVASGSPGAQKQINLEINNTRSFVKPLVEAMQLEGHYKFTEPCFKDPNWHCGMGPTNSDGPCDYGSQWAQQAQVIMANITANCNHCDIVDTNCFWPVDKAWPPNEDYLPSVEATGYPGKSCPYHSNCHLKSRSYGEARYATGDSSNTGFPVNEFGIAATQLNMKLSGQQRCWKHAAVPGYKDCDSRDKDNPLAKEVNAVVWRWAQENAGTFTMKRFQKSGQQMKFDKDVATANYEAWDKNAICYEDWSDGTLHVHVTTSPYCLGVPEFGGDHLVQLVSPGLAMEWIYTDGLRAQHSLPGAKRPPRPKCKN